jgi:hypothetical protein
MNPDELQPPRVSPTTSRTRSAANGTEPPDRATEPAATSESATDQSHPLVVTRRRRNQGAFRRRRRSRQPDADDDV